MSLEGEEELDLKELEAQILQFVDKSDVEEMLRLQISELEMLQSMFSNPGEFCMDDYGAIADVHEYLDGRCTILPPQLDFTINLLLETVRVLVIIHTVLGFCTCTHTKAVINKQCDKGVGWGQNKSL